MKLGDATREYVASKQAMGMVFTAEAYVLRTFTEKLRPNIPIKKVTSDSVLDYLNGRGPATLFWHRKHDALSGFWRDLRFAEDGGGILAMVARGPTQRNLVATLANLCAESRAGPAGL